MLFFYNLLDLADLFLNFSIDNFKFAFSFQAAIFDNFANNLFDLACNLMHLAFCFVLCAGFHSISPVKFRFYPIPNARANFLDCDVQAVRYVLDLDSIQGHIIYHHFYAMNVIDKFAGQVFFRRIPGFASEADHAIFGLDSGAEGTRRAMMQQCCFD